MAIFRSIFLMMVGLIALPFLFIFNFRTMWGFTKSLFTGLADVSLADPEFRKRIEFRRVSATPSMETRKAVVEECRALVEADDWLALSNRLRDWDSSRAECEAGYPLAAVARRAVLYDLAEAVVEGHDCHPDPIAILKDEVAERLETLAAMHSESYPLLALAAEARCYQGWYARGADYSEYVSDDGWFGMGQHFSRAAWLIDRFDPVAMDAPLLAAARHRLLAFMPDAGRHALRFYEEWSALNPRDQEPHERHALMMLPRWFGTAGTLEIEARKAVARTAKTTGEAAYFSIYAKALDISDPHVLDLDIAAMTQGAHDCVTLRGADPAYVAELFQKMAWWTAFGSDRHFNGADRERWAEIAAGLEALRREVLLKRLEAICPSAWDDGLRGALGAISHYVQQEIAAGASFSLGNDGLAIRPGEDAPA